MALPPLAALRQAAVTFGGRPTFAEVSFGVARGERVCLVGRNGGGKSTLLKALAGAIELDAGERFVQPGAHLAYMPQEPVLDPDATAAQHVAGGLPDGETLANSRYRVEAALDQVGIAPDRRLEGFSGGETRRLSLARALVGEPEVLLLDEPTNHLDVPTIEWLEERLASYPGAVVTISHDRALLNRIAQRVLWLDRGRLHAMTGRFTGFDAWAEAILANEAAEAQRLDKKLATETLWLRQGISARRTRNMGRVRALQALRQERAGRVSQHSVRLGEAVAEATGKMVIECEDVTKSWLPHRPVIQDFSTRIMRGDRVGIVGPNGAGKSTLLKILTGAIEPDSGRIRFAANLKPAFFDQNRAGLDGKRSVRENLVDGGDTIFVRGEPRHILSYLGDFLFDERQARTPVEALSGGERNRLLLAKVLAQPSNLLVLDEPTNDLDMDTLDLLEDVLADYAGTLLLVSHDRDFLDRLVTGVIAVEGGGVVHEYVGGWSDYQRQRPADPVPSSIVRKAAPKLAPTPMGDRAPPKPRFSFRDKRELDLLAKAIEAMTRERAALEATLADAGLYARDRAGFDTAMRRLETIRTEIESAEERWLDLELARAEIEE